MNTEIINEITANVPSTFEKSVYSGERYTKYVNKWYVYFHVNGMHIRATILIGERKCCGKVEYCGVHVSSVYVNDKRLNDCRFGWNRDTENREAIDKLKQKIQEIAELQPDKIATL